jgi:hypothetical protein
VSSYEDDLFAMMDGKLTNYISDLRKDDPDYTKKREYFKDLILFGKGALPDAAETFERNGHGKVYTPDRIQEETVAARQSVSERTLPPYASNGGKKKKTPKRRHRKSQQTRRHRRRTRRS